jgi:hypothetical protein
MGFENFNVDDNDNAPDTVVVTEQASNRTFLLILLALGGIAVLTLACIGAYLLVFRPRSLAQRAALEQTLTAQAAEVEGIVAMTATSDEATAIAAAWTATPSRTPIPPTDTPTPSPTPVVAVATADVNAPTLTAGPDDATATALHATLDANATLYVATLTAGPSAPTPTPTRIPAAGFADDVGLPAMLGMAALLIVVIFVARRLRTA